MAYRESNPNFYPSYLGIPLILSLDLHIPLPRNHLPSDFAVWDFSAHNNPRSPTYLAFIFRTQSHLHLCQNHEGQVALNALGISYHLLSYVFLVDLLILLFVFRCFTEEAVLGRELKAWGSKSFPLCVEQSKTRVCGASRKACGIATLRDATLPLAST